MKNGNNKSSFYNFFKEVVEDNFLFFLPLGAILVRWVIFLVIPLTYEDSYITFRYAENFADGNGLVYNLGEKVYGTTTPLFALLIGIFNFIGISSISASLFLNLFFEGVVTLIIYLIFKNYSNRYLAAVVSILFILSPSNISWSVQGMETAFFGGIIALAFYSFYKENYSASLLFAFLSSCIRIDGLSVAAVIVISVFYMLKARTFKLLIAPLSLFLGWLLFLYIYFGDFLPNSMIAKLILYSGHQSSSLPNLKLLISKFFFHGYYTSAIVTFFFITGIYVVLKSRSRLLPMIIWFFIYYASFIISKTHIHAWYLIPPLFAYIIVSGIGIIRLTEIILNWFSRFRKVIFITFTAVLILFSLFTVLLKIKQMSEEHRYAQDVRVKLGLYLKNNTPVNSTVLLEPIGIIGYFSERYIFDEAALISPFYLELNRLPFDAYNRYKKVELVQPDFIVLRETELEDFYSETNLLREYDPVREFPYEAAPFDKESVGYTVFKRKI